MPRLRPASAARLLRALPLLALAACAAPSGPDTSERFRAATAAAIPLPAFDTKQPFPPARSNVEMAHDILELGFFLESGREIAQFSRFERPVRVALAGQVPPGAGVETDRLLARMRAEAGLDITRVPDRDAEVIVEFLPGRQMRALVPLAACFVVPNVSSFAEFRANPRAQPLDWAQVVERTQVAVFIPSDAPPQEVRDCLHEEIAQAVGPLNDLFRLPDTVFNDDNFQTSLTGFDMLVLRAWHAPELRVGMSRDEVAARLPAILRRLNPRGERIAPPARLAEPSPREWVDAVEAALGAASSASERRRAAARALTIANAQGWTGPRLAFSLFLITRVAPPDAGETALAALLQAQRIYADMPGGEVHAAHMDLHVATQALGAGQLDLAIALTERALEPAQRTRNAALAATLKVVQAEALARGGRTTEAARLRDAAAPLALWGFGRPDALEARISEVAELR